MSADIAPFSFPLRFEAFDFRASRAETEPSSSFEAPNLPRDLVIILTCHLLHYDCMRVLMIITDGISGL